MVCGDNARLKEEGATVDNMDPSRPFLYLEKFDQKKMDEWVKIKSVWAAKNVKNDIMTDPTPQVLFLFHLQNSVDRSFCYISYFFLTCSILVYLSSPC